MPKISVVVATYNRAELLRESLDSLFAQRRPPDQVLVVDDGSSDDTPEVLNRYGDRLERVRTENGGKARALNLVLPQVRGDYLWIFDDDDLALPDGLERLVARAQERPDADLIYGSYSYLIGDKPPTHVPLPEVEEDGVFLRNLVQNFLQQQSMLVRTSCYRQVGPFDESLLCSEDFDMAQRLTRRFTCVALPGPPVFIFRLHTGRRGSAGQQFDHTERNRMWLRYDRRIISSLVADMALWEFLPGRQPRDLNATERRRALLQRMCIVARRGLWDREQIDLEAALEADPETPLDPAEEAIWRRTFGASYGRHIAFEELATKTQRADRFRELLRGPVGDRLRHLFLHRLDRVLERFRPSGGSQKTLAAHLKALRQRMAEP